MVDELMVQEFRGGIGGACEFSDRYSIDGKGDVGKRGDTGYRVGEYVVHVHCRPGEMDCDIRNAMRRPVSGIQPGSVVYLREIQH